MKITTLEFSEKYKEKTKNRILSSIKINENLCWVWQKCKNSIKQPHGRIAVMNHGKRIHALAHRVSFYLWKGDIPSNMYVMHKCNNPSCCNPDHIEIGTQKTNMAYMYETGRGYKNPVKGEKHPHAKLNLEKVIKMRFLHSKGVNCGILGRQFGVSTGSARDVVKLKSWRHV